MRSLAGIGILLAVGLALSLLFGSAHATVITYEATDLANTTAGEDLWQYTDTVSGHTFAVDTGVTISLDYALYGAVDPSPLSPDSDWDVLTQDILESVTTTSAPVPDPAVFLLLGTGLVSLTVFTRNTHPRQ